MKTVLIAGIAVVLLASTAVWPSRPTIPGDQFQLAAGDAVASQSRAVQDNGFAAQTWQIAGKSIMSPVAKGEGWM
jgi:hypothetical protein